MSNIIVNISKKVFNKVYLPLLNCVKRYLIIYGGAGSGKSYFIGERYIYKILTQSKMNLMVVRNVARSNRDSTFALLNQVIHNWNLEKLFAINKGDLRIRCINGNEIIFAGLDDVEKLKSITFSKGELTDIWVEEASEIKEKDFNQLDVRLRGGDTKKQIVVSFNPIDVKHWLKKRFIDKKADNIEVCHTTYKDNDFLDEDYKLLLESYKDTDPYYYNVYCLGEWGVLGNTIFDANAIYKRLQEVKEPISQGYFLYDYDGTNITNIRWHEDKNGYIKIYKQPCKKNYEIGGDTAGEGSDYYIGQVLDQDASQVAVLRHQMDSDLYVKQMYCLGKYYNEALLTIEVNFDSHPIMELQRLRYANMYIREVNDTALDKHKKSYGFRTDKWTRPHILNYLIEIVRDHVELINDRDTLEEMLTFVRNEKGRMEAASGSHDDLVMALAIAHEGLNQLVPYKEKTVKRKVRRNDFDNYWG